MKTNRILIKTVLTGIVILLSFNSCQKKFFDVNKNPNAPADVDVNFLLPTTEAAVGQALGNDLAIHGGMWAQYWTQNPNSSQYKTIDQYAPVSSDFDFPWDALYTNGLLNMATIVTKATAENKPNYAACAKILQAYTFQLLTDDFGDIPFSQALQGATGITSPKFDPQQQVYTGIIKLLNDANALINQNSSVVPGTDDLLFGGSMGQWQKFANTLLLRVYLRMSYVDPATAQAGIAALATNNAIFLAAGDSVYIDYTSTGGNTNPYYATTSILGDVQNLVASSTAINYLINNNDYRIYAYYDPATTGNYVGIAQGNYNAQTATFAIPSPITGADVSSNYTDYTSSASAPVRLMTSWESLFLQSEAVARGWLPTTYGTDQSLYYQGITESFVRCNIGLMDSDAFNYYSQPGIAYPTGSLENKVQAIITQKWISMCGVECNEGWTEWRRTGYPNFFTQSVTSILGAGQFPQRMFYPSGEEEANQNFPGQKPITTKVWWDVH